MSFHNGHPFCDMKYAVRNIVVVVSAIVALSVQVWGQNPWLNSNYPHIDPVGDYLSRTWTTNQVISSTLSSQMFMDAAKRRAGVRSGSTAGRPNAPAQLGPTQFRPSGYVLPGVIAGLEQGDANAKAEIKQAATGLLDLYHSTAKKDGFPSNDLAYAFEYFVVNNYIYANDLMDVYADPKIAAIADPYARLQAYSEKKLQQVTITGERAVYGQFVQVLSARPEVKKMTDRQKQETAELLALMTGIAYSRYTAGMQNRDQEVMERGRQKAKDNLEKLVGVSADRIRISDSGLQF